MTEQPVEQELEALEREWTEAIIRRDMEVLEGIVGREYTLTANGFPGKTRFTREEWMATVPFYDVHSYDQRNLVAHSYGDTAVVLADLDMNATVRGSDRSGSFALTDVWIRRDGRWQVVARSSIFTPTASGRV